MFKAVKSIDKKHQENLIVLTYENNSGKVLTTTNNAEAAELVKGLDKSEGSLNHKIYLQRLDNNKQNLILIHLGNLKGSDDEYRQGFAKAFRSIEAATLREANLCTASLKLNGKISEKIAAIFSESFAVAAYKYFDIYKKDKKAYSLSVQYIASKNLISAVDTGLKLADAINFARELGDTPANLMTPTILAKRVVEKARGTKLKINVWDKARIKRERFNLLLSVAQGSSQEPRVIFIEYKGGKKSQKPITLVGKALTFDTGGISLKPGQGLEEMKYDMCGGANIIGALFAMAALGVKANVNAIIGSSENMPGPSATKPGDVFVSRNGLSVEVNNTDAEGRLLLADILAYASEQKPAAICDAATLTGAILIALGNIHTGYFTSNDALAKKIEDSAKLADENIWRMPVVKEHGEDMKGTFADLSNLGNSRNAGSSTAAAFLKNFVPEEIPYAHFDIAGTAWNCENRSKLYRKGATGCMVRTFVRLAESFK